MSAIESGRVITLGNPDKSAFAGLVEGESHLYVRLTPLNPRRELAEGTWDFTPTITGEGNAPDFIVESLAQDLDDNIASRHLAITRLMNWLLEMQELLSVFSTGWRWYLYNCKGDGERMMLYHLEHTLSRWLRTGKEDPEWPTDEASYEELSRLESFMLMPVSNTYNEDDD
ncbi:hypothetical protein COV06_00310 [Candidatus Uhrbacteria bacterium CG10_big_fil_rev_8_21_14_0_10_50_16]|uniref:Uncharacterized protein n=1 Tax=Candidatus Uhrbacteria bacterium CG10_big_fil_rev_8_21_14_0_10_50_16 TaxID=1975039 RepID=A0A2H0RMV3_9BACT|nr:MAG: hypothetical protein COV06_00310 [Candidatus Uhrbacteria bacterium CG10_big_fil_rev_8_21_14_0_10_50_16]